MLPPGNPTTLLQPPRPTSTTRPPLHPASSPSTLSPACHPYADRCPAAWATCSRPWQPRPRRSRSPCFGAAAPPPRVRASAQRGLTSSSRTAFPRRSSLSSTRSHRLRSSSRARRRARPTATAAPSCRRPRRRSPRRRRRGAPCGHRSRWRRWCACTRRLWPPPSTPSTACCPTRPPCGCSWRRRCPRPAAAAAAATATAAAMVPAPAPARVRAQVRVGVRAL